MKKTLFTLALIIMGFMAKAFALPISEIRENARFLSDRMAYELELTSMQYEDCYEINYDFIYAINDLMDDVVYGTASALDEYYRLLDYRNEDLRYVLNSHQYARFIALEYFYRPIYRHGRSWAFRIYTIYHNRSFFYFGLPSIYHTYHGAHSHHHFHHDYYVSRHHHHIHREPVPIHRDHRRSDFGRGRSERRGAVERHDHGNGRVERPNRNQRQDGTRPQRNDSRSQRSESRPQRSESRPQHSESSRPSRHNNGGGENRSSSRPSAPSRSHSSSGTRSGVSSGGHGGGNHGGGNHGGGNHGGGHSGHRR